MIDLDYFLGFPKQQEPTMVTDPCINVHFNTERTSSPGKLGSKCCVAQIAAKRDENARCLQLGHTVLPHFLECDGFFGFPFQIFGAWNRNAALLIFPHPAEL